MLRYSVLILLVLSASPSRAQENLTNLISDVRILTLDSSSSLREHLSDSQITTFLNQGQREILAGNHCLQQTIVFQLSLGATYYSLPSKYNVIERITIGGKSIPQMTPAALDGQSLGWEYASGYPNRFFINFSSRGLVGFTPWPQQSTDTDTIKVDFDISPNDLVNPSDYPFNGVNELQDYDHSLAYWASSTIEQLYQQPQRAQYYMALYQTMATMMVKMCRDLKDYRPSASAQP